MKATVSIWWTHYSYTSGRYTPGRHTPGEANLIIEGVSKIDYPGDRVNIYHSEPDGQGKVRLRQDSYLSTDIKRMVMIEEPLA